MADGSATSSLTMSMALWVFMAHEKTKRSLACMLGTDELSARELDCHALLTTYLQVIGCAALLLT
jgi:hypothetical protein